MRLRRLWKGCRPTVLNPALPNWAKRGNASMALSNFPNSNNKGPSFSQADYC